MVQISGVLVPLLYSEKDLPEGLDPAKQAELVELAINTGWRVRFYKVFEYKNVIYERYIFEREVNNG